MKKHLLSAFLSIAICLSAVTVSVAEAQPRLDSDIIAYAQFGNDVVQYGGKFWVGEKNVPAVAYEKGKYGWVLDPAKAKENAYIYCDVDDAIMYNLTDGSTVSVEVEYFDNKKSSMTLEYGKYSYPKSTTLVVPDMKTNIVSSPKTELEIVDFKNSQSWKKHTFYLTKAAMKNTLAGGADFSVCMYSDMMRYSKGRVIIHSITVRKTGTKDVFDLAVSSNKLGNIFFTGEDMKFEVTLDPSSYKFQSMKHQNTNIGISYKLVDSDGKVVAEKEETVSLASLEKIKTKVNFGTPQNYDVYKFVVEVKNDEYELYSTDSWDCSYVFTTYGEVQNKHHGVSVALKSISNNAEDDFAKLVRNAGYSLARLNHSPNHFITSAFDNKTRPGNILLTGVGFRSIIRSLIENNVGVSIYSSGKGQYVASADGIKIPDSNKKSEIANYVDFQRKMLLDYGDTAVFFEIDNEPNIISPSNEDKYATRYVEMAKEVYKAVKTERPDILVGGATVSGDDVSWIEDFLKLGGGEYCDVLSIHPYRWGTDPITSDLTKPSLFNSVNLKDIRKLLDEYGYYDMGMCASEYGYPAYFYNCSSYMQKAAWDVQAYFLLTQENLCEQLVLFRFEGIDLKRTRESMEYHFNIIGGPQDKVPFAANEGYLAQSVLNYKMSDAEYKNRTDIEENHTIMYQYKKKNSNQDMLVLFSNYASDHVSLDLGLESVNVTDMLGNEQTLCSDSGIYTFAVSEKPTYIEGNFEKCDVLDSGIVYPENDINEVSYGTTKTINIINKTGKKIHTSVELLPNSQIKVINDELEAIKFELGQYAPSGEEPVKVIIKDDGGNICYSGDIILKYVDQVDVSSMLVLKNKKWMVKTTLRNTSTNTEFNGMVRVAQPVEWSNVIKPVDVRIAPGEVAEFYLELPQSAEDFTGQNLILSVENSLVNTAIAHTKKMDFTYAAYARGIEIDGDLTDWQNVGWIHLNQPDMFNYFLGFDNEYTGVEDLSAKFGLMWDEDNLYFAAEIYDDVHFTSNVSVWDMWALDNIQLGILYDPESSISDSSTFEELSFSLMPNGESLVRHKASGTRWLDGGAVDNYRLKIIRNEERKVTTYELMVPWESITPLSGIRGKDGNEFKFSMCLNENDGTGRGGYFGFGDGIANGKSSDMFMNVTMLNNDN